MNYREWKLQLTYTHFQTSKGGSACRNTHMKMNTTRNVWVVNCPACLASTEFQEAKAHWVKKPQTAIANPAKPCWSREQCKCWYCGNTGHTERCCKQKRHDLERMVFKNR